MFAHCFTCSKDTAAASRVSRALAADSGGHKGEFTLVVGGAPDVAGTRAEELSRIVAILLKTQPPSQAAAIAAEITGASRKEAYRVAEQIKADGIDILQGLQAETGS